ncbi:homeobox protein Dlx3b-like [Centruroides vittatus]|uniref:homeobox protein Dlx3b-like n=1 Tax=Centruroides vittatus TaxID=120091 RepID=UPI0035103369
MKPLKTNLENSLTSIDEETKKSTLEISELEENFTENQQPDASDPSVKSAPIDTRRERTIFTNTQLRALEERFIRHPYIDKHERAELGKQIGLTEIKIKIWFQNRRMKVKKLKLTQKYLNHCQFLYGLRNCAVIPPPSFINSASSYMYFPGNIPKYSNEHMNHLSNYVTYPQQSVPPFLSTENLVPIQALTRMQVSGTGHPTAMQSQSTGHPTAMQSQSTGDPTCMQSTSNPDLNRAPSHNLFRPYSK